MKKILLNNEEYDLIENYKDGFDKEALEEKFTDYFYDYDYILGDWSYSKLRLKGFCDNNNNKKYNKINNYSNKANYLKNECAFECKYFVIKKGKSI